MSQHDLSLYDPASQEVHKALQLAKSTGAAPEVIQSLESALQLVRLREDFAEQSTSQQSQTLKEIIDESYRHDWAEVQRTNNTNWRLSPRMLTGPLEGQFLKSIVSIQKAKRVLEVGLFTGYGALAMAEALPADGELVSVDLENYLKNLVTDLTKSSPHHEKIKIIVGSAVDVIKDLTERGEKFDLIFLDANESDYLSILKFAFEGGLLNPGGTMLVDNGFRHGRSYIPSEDQPPMKKFVQAVSADPSLHKVLVPIRDGVLIIRRIQDVEGSVSKS